MGLIGKGDPTCPGLNELVQQAKSSLQEVKDKIRETLHILQSAQDSASSNQGHGGISINGNVPGEQRHADILRQFWLTSSNCSARAKSHRIGVWYGEPGTWAVIHRAFEYW